MRRFLRGVLHAAWFVQWTAKFDAAQPQAPVAPHPGSDPDAVLAAIRKRDPDQARRATPRHRRGLSVA